MKTEVQSHLLDEEALEGDVLAGLVRKRHGDNVGQSLSLVDDGVREGEVLPVFHLNLPRPYDPAQLLLDLVWRQKCPVMSPVVSVAVEPHLVSGGTWP